MSSPLALLFDEPQASGFVERHLWGERPRFFAGAPQRFAAAGLVAADFDDVEALLSAHEGRASAGLMGGDGLQRMLHGVRPSTALELYGCGATLHLNNFEKTVNREGWTAFVSELAAELGLRPELVRCTAFAAGVVGGGSPAHWDSKDIFVLHLSGEKRWTVGPNDALQNPMVNAAPFARDGQSAFAPLVRAEETFTLTPGSALFLPRGYWHRTEVTGAPCFAITLGFERPAWVHLLALSLKNQLGRRAQWREPIGSLFGPLADAAAVAKFDERVSELGELLRNIDARALLAEVDGWAKNRRYVRTGAKVEVQRGPGGEPRALELDDAVLELPDADSFSLAEWAMNRSDAFSLSDALSQPGPGSPGDREALLDALLEAGVLERPQDVWPEARLAAFHEP